MKEGLVPIVTDSVTKLILGTLPGKESLRVERYYAHLENDLKSLKDLLERKSSS